MSGATQVGDVKQRVSEVPVVGAADADEQGGVLTPSYAGKRH
eukprot:SAG11_NODE_22972_length_397_cov_0.859060_1_plen_41_part_10